MKKPLCIVLRSIYPSKIEECDRWNEEVSTDSETVTETLSAHDVREIAIPVHTKQKTIIALVNQFIDSISVLRYESCHIVLNTHGNPGKSDLADEAVKLVICGVSSLGISVSQLSALQCNGMSALSSQEQREANPMMSLFVKARGKDSSLSILQQKLNHTSTARAQVFNIHGFNKAYDPIFNKEEVIDVLRGEGESLPVMTFTHSLPSPKTLPQIADSIKVIKETKASNRKGNSRYETAGNILGAVLEQMKNNLFTALRSGMNPDPEDIPLYKMLYEYAQQQSQPLNPTNAERLYKSWVKTFKLYSNERVELFQKYHSILLQKVTDTHKHPSFFHSPPTIETTRNDNVLIAQKLH